MHYLSFDCATKTFAYSLSYVNLDISHILKDFIQDLQGEQGEQGIQSLVHKYYLKMKSIIYLMDGAVVDFFPNIPDNKINTVDRIQKMSNYIKDTIIPKINDIPDIEIFIEFQMGSNHKARMISSALIALFSKYKVRLINPSLKNKVYVTEEGKHKHFIKKYTNLYSANKEHAKYNFALIEDIFKSDIPHTKKAERGHIADSFMQVLGYLLYLKDI
uniref:Uncharacterized protein n=1 Tax=viral metagenome TaxID=1070528 RepID=A0A6C0I271_9ZZZZ